MTSAGLYLFNYRDDARCNKHKKLIPLSQDFDRWLSMSHSGNKMDAGRCWDETWFSLLYNLFECMGASCTWWSDTNRCMWYFAGEFGVYCTALSDVSLWKVWQNDTFWQLIGYRIGLSDMAFSSKNGQWCWVGWHLKVIMQGLVVVGLLDAATMG